jgi:hypothetical protein
VRSSGRTLRRNAISTHDVGYCIPERLSCVGSFSRFPDEAALCHAVTQYRGSPGSSLEQAGKDLRVRCKGCGA